LQDWVRDIHAGKAAPANNTNMNWVKRFESGWAYVKDIVGKVWPYLVIGILVGAGIHGFVP
jgi:uncharacterized membrane protein YraQ (UPF0718 family)